MPRVQCEGGKKSGEGEGGGGGVEGRREVDKSVRHEMKVWMEDGIKEAGEGEVGRGEVEGRREVDKSERRDKSVDGRWNKGTR